MVCKRSKSAKSATQNASALHFRISRIIIIRFVIHCFGAELRIPGTKCQENRNESQKIASMRDTISAGNPFVVCVSCISLLLSSANRITKLIHETWMTMRHRQFWQWAPHTDATLRLKWRRGGWMMGERRTLSRSYENKIKAFNRNTVHDGRAIGANSLMRLNSESEQINRIHVWCVRIPYSRSTLCAHNNGFDISHTPKASRR